MSSDLANKIKKVRTKLGMTSLQFANKIGFSPRALDEVERGLLTPPPDLERKVNALIADLMANGDPRFRFF